MNVVAINAKQGGPLRRIWHAVGQTVAVEIPIVRFLQQFQMWQILRDDDLFPSMTKSLAVGPDACTDCGACEEKCPSNLPIRELLKEMSGDLERVGITVPAE